MKARYAFSIAGLLAVSLAASAAAISGTVTNGTTNKPAASDDVALIALSQGMQVAASAKTDAQGKFSFSFEDNGMPHLVRVTHQGVNYFPQGGPIGPNVSTVDLTVYDSVKNLDAVSTTVNVLRLQSDGGSLQVMQLIAVNNTSAPPRTLNSDKGYAFSVPDGAQIDEASTQAPNGMPVAAMPIPDDKQKGTYYFAFPIRPGETRFQLAYHMPYSGDATISPKLLTDMQHFVVMMPKSMSFEPKNPGLFSPMKDPQGGDALVEVSTQAKTGTDLTFHVKGTGVLNDQPAQAGNNAVGMQGGGAVDNRPGGGLGRPIDTPDPLASYRWVILGALGVVLAGGGYLAVSRSRSNGAAPPIEDVDEIEFAKPRIAVPARASAAAAPVSTVAASAAPIVDRSQMLLEGLKEEMFQLELERQQGSISQPEYEKAKAALDQTLQRALARKKS